MPRTSLPTLLLLHVHTIAAFNLPLSATKPATSLAGLTLPRVSDSEPIDIGSALASSTGKTMLVLGTHAYAALSPPHASPILPH